ncbi:AAA family ATPase [Sphaerospermopsis sp. LEGE 00249]|uniref:AAA family ATPase n=1 Tax=Sphaerospermopsis sp. LEGE 00249 TaxID=1380707 RepID=UPI00164E00BB|nr:AAA family ATPase [Sphaerospermopsis sp. LEGE 00249]MBC5793866.1 AAA family ATPase [Sphaerospermopsis sp. LEGE 00249]
MQKIIIKNFAAIEYAEIEVKKILVLIGEQASGKSTIAKLIYFFQSIRDDLFSQIYQDTQKDYFDITSDLIFPIREKFYDFFGSTFHLPDFEIKFYYSFENDKYLRLTLDDRKKLYPKFLNSNFLNEDFKSSASKMKKLFQQGLTTNAIHEQLAFDQNRIKYVQRLSSLLNELFEIYYTNPLFVIAGRNATVSYSDFFEKYLFASVQNTIEGNRRKGFQPKEQTIDETLMLKFMERVGKIKDKFKKFDNFEGLIEIYEETTIKQKLYLINNHIARIIKGEYRIDNRGEKIVFNQETEEYIDLSNASSGQQEVIRILQDIFLNILDDVKVLRIIEEPEAHLFPIAQKELIELLSVMVNHDQDNQLIITTHSPYILTVFNNLLFANRVVEKNPSAESEVAEIIPKDSWLKAEDFSAYSLGNQSVSETTHYCQSIFNAEKGTIQQNYLDTVSEILGGDFQTLYSVHARTFKRR